MASTAPSPSGTEVLDNSSSEKVQSRTGAAETSWVVPAGEQAVYVDPEVTRRALRKIDRFLIPAMIFGYGLAVYDKAILGSAALFGMTTDLSLSVGSDTSRLSWATSIFYFGQLAGSYPMTYILQHVSPRWSVGTAVMVWAIVAASTAGVTTYQTLYVQRFFLGFTEAMIPTSFFMIIAGFYTQKEQAVRQTLWFSGAGLFTAIGPSLNYGFSRVDASASLHSWQYCYIFAGALTFLFGLWCFFLPDSPKSAWFLTPDERIAAVERLRLGQTGIRNSTIKWTQVKEAVLDVKIWLFFVIMSSGYTSNGAVTGFGPLIVATFGYTPLESSLLQLPIGFLCAFSTAAAGYLASRKRNIRIPILVACTLPVIAGFIIIWKSSWQGPKPVAPVVGYSLIGFFGGVCGLVVPIASSNVAGETKKSFASAAVFVGYCVGNIVGPQMVRSQEKGDHYPTLWGGLIGCYGITIVSASTLYFLLWRENKRRAALNLDPAEAEKLGFRDLTDKENAHFVYAL